MRHCAGTIGCSQFRAGGQQDLGIQTYGAAKKIDGIFYEKLRTSGKVLERIVPLVIKER